MTSRYPELVKKYQELNEFTLSGEDMELYRSFQDKLTVALEKADNVTYPERFQLQNNLIHIKPFDDIIVVADLHGHICYGNEEFYKYTGLERECVENDTENLRLNKLRHPDMPKTIFKDLWTTIKEGRMWSGVICNHNLKGQDYWQIVNIFPIIENGEMVNYIAFNKRAPESIIGEIINFYRKIP